MKIFESHLPVVPTLLLAILLPVQAALGQFSANAIEGRVLEAGTAAPLEGVIVVVNWELVGSAKLPVGQLMVMETVTDKDGGFSFPAWGPKTAPSETVPDPNAPQLLFFKEGYEYRRLVNPRVADTSADQVISSAWNGRTIGMRRLPDEMIVTLGEGRVVSRRGLSTNGLSLSLTWAYRGKECEWQRAPRMLSAVHKTKLDFDRQGIRTDLRSIDDLPASAKCGSPKVFLRSYLP